MLVSAQTRDSLASSSLDGSSIPSVSVGLDLEVCRFLVKPREPEIWSVDDSVGSVWVKELMGKRKRRSRRKRTIREEEEEGSGEKGVTDDCPNVMN